MTDTKYLNLDEILPPIEKIFKFKGVEHKMVTPTVENVLMTVREAEAADKEFKANPTPEKVVERMIKNIRLAFPTLPDDDLKSMTMDQLARLHKFVVDVAEDAAADGAPKEGEPGN